MSRPGPLPTDRVMGIETEYGILGAGAAEVIGACLEAARRDGRPEGVRWDYTAEQPLRDARGFEMRREDAHPAMLTDETGAPGPVPGARAPRTSAAARLTDLEESWQRGTSTCLPDGGRLYDDHGHPEYATPECSTPAQAVLHDLAGQTLLADGAALLASRGSPVRLFKNNIDGKGASYGTHENILVPRAVPFEALAQALIPLLVARPLLTGAGRAGTGVVTSGARLQASQRADYIETVIGLPTVMNRPLINTRDEPHADPARWRRLHLIPGDASAFPTITWLALGIAALVCRCAEDPTPGAAPWRRLALADPITELRAVSRDTSLAHRLALADGGSADPLDVLDAYLDAVVAHLDRAGAPHPAPESDPLAPDLAALADGLDADGRETGALLAFWEASINELRRLRAGEPGAAGHLEWVAKGELLRATAQRHPGPAGEPVLHAVDLAWGELGTGLAHRVPAAAAAAGGLDEARIRAALATPPPTTRAWLRGRLLARFPGAVRAAGWQAVVLDAGGEHDERLALDEPTAYGRTRTEPLLRAPGTPRDFLEALVGTGRLGPPQAAALTGAGTPTCPRP